MDKGGEGNRYAMPWKKSCGHPCMYAVNFRFSITLIFLSTPEALWCQIELSGWVADWVGDYLTIFSSNNISGSTIDLKLKLSVKVQHGGRLMCILCIGTVDNRYSECRHSMVGSCCQE